MFRRDAEQLVTVVRPVSFSVSFKRPTTKEKEKPSLDRCKTNNPVLDEVGSF